MNIRKGIIKNNKKEEFIMGVLDMIRGEIQSKKTLNNKEQRIFSLE